MRVRVSFPLVVLALLPSMALAQFGGGGGGGMGGGMGGRGGPGGMGGMGGPSGRRGGEMGGPPGGANRAPPKFPEAKDLQNYNPATLLIDKRKKLSLSDSQVAAFKTLESKIYERNAPLLVRYDSARREFRPPTDAPRDTTAASNGARAAAMDQLRLMRSLLDSLQDRRRTDVHDALDMLSDDKTKLQAAKFIDEQDKDFDKQMPQMGPAGGRPAGEGGGRRGREGS